MDAEALVSGLGPGEWAWPWLAVLMWLSAWQMWWMQEAMRLMGVGSCSLHGCERVGCITTSWPLQLHCSFPLPALLETPPYSPCCPYTRVLQAQLAQREGVDPGQVLPADPSPRELFRLTPRCHSRLQNVVGKCWAFHAALPATLPQGVSAGAAYFWRRELDPHNLSASPTGS